MTPYGLQDPASSTSRPKSNHESFKMVNPDTDAEVRPCVTSFATRAERSLFSERFQRFSTWESLLRAVSFLIHQARSHSSSISTSHACKGWHQCSKIITLEEQTAAKRLILLHAQKELYPESMLLCRETNKFHIQVHCGISTPTSMTVS